MCLDWHWAVSIHDLTESSNSEVGSIVPILHINKLRPEEKRI